MYNSALLFACRRFSTLQTSVADVAVIAHKSKRNVVYIEPNPNCGFIGTNTPRPNLMV
jgi:hypothetical protein